MNTKIRIWTGIRLFPEADYEINEDVTLGTIVNVSFRKKNIYGVVIKINPDKVFKTLKIAEKTLFHLSEDYLKFIKSISQISLNDMSQCLKSMLQLFSKKEYNHQNILSYNSVELSEEQKSALNNIKDKIYLLWGVTGSGKTEIFFEKIYECLLKNQQVLILFPEIAITEGMIHRFEKRFGFGPVVWNSKSKNKTKFMNIYNGNASIIIGSRSSIFLPYKNLGLIIVDEEHDNSYKQVNVPIYNCRDAAVILGSIKKIPVILASATPSLESFYNCKLGNYELLKLESRYKGLSTPKMHIEISDYNEICSKNILKKVSEVLDRKQQVIFFLNKRGFSQVVMCKSCFTRMICQKCDFFLTHHLYPASLICHNCNAKYDHKNCYNCGANSTLTSYGLGVEKIHSYLQTQFPDKCIQVISSDTCDSAEKIKEFLDNMNNKVIDIAIGTQMLSKGHNFPDIALVVILGFGNSAFSFRSNEYTLQTLIQVAGRAGRSKINSEVILQTEKHLDSNLIKFFTTQDYYGFLEYELEYRKKWNITPFIKIIIIKYCHKDLKMCMDKLNKLKNQLIDFGFFFFSSPIFIVKKLLYHYQIITKITRDDFVRNNFSIIEILTKEYIVDVDPIGCF